MSDRGGSVHLSWKGAAKRSHTDRLRESWQRVLLVLQAHHHGSQGHVPERGYQNLLMRCSPLRLVVDLDRKLSTATEHAIKHTWLYEVSTMRLKRRWRDRPYSAEKDHRLDWIRKNVRR